MMREILFRGKRIDNGEWVEGYLVEKHDPLLGTVNCFILVQEFDYSCITGEPTILMSQMTWYKVNPETVGQFTGLTDKNGKKIFEGDIIKFHKYRDEPDWVGVVIYEYCTYFAKGKMPLAYKKEIDKEAFHCPFEVTTSGIDKATIEVIGNIHDNPELLEGV